MQDINRLKELFIPNGEDGTLEWKVDYRRAKVGDLVSASAIKSPYKLLKIDGSTLSVHRILWLMLKGPIKSGDVLDHINGDTHDNRICNLRVCSHAENMRNRKVHSNNRSGLKGVYSDSSILRAKPWRAQIRVNGRKINLGRFDTANEAHDAYLKASQSLHGEFSSIG